MRRFLLSVGIAVACLVSSEAPAFATVNPTPDPSQTATPVYLSSASSDLVYGFAVLAFLLAAAVTLLIALVVNQRSS